MNILFISKLSGKLWAGPNNSVPAQVKAQSEVDHCLWYNLNSIKLENWLDDKVRFLNLADIPSGRLQDLPSPFNRPDLAVVEEVYCFPFEKIINDLIKYRIPYIVIPRSQLTIQAQKKKPWKKIIGNALWFNRMISNCSAIQYLTQEEKTESENQWKKPSFVIPNGTDIRGFIRPHHDQKRLHLVYVGRIEIYQKGLDLLPDALKIIKDKYGSDALFVDLYGPDRDNSLMVLQQRIHEAQLEDLIAVHDAVFGQEKEEVLKNADVFVMTSRFEGLPMGLIEALSYSLPAIATKGTNMADVIQEADAGWIAENNVESIVDAFEAMLGDKDRIDEMAENARALSLKYSWNDIANRSHIKYQEFSR